MEANKNLQPESVWKYFQEITQVPRPSKKEEKIIKYLIDFAKENNLAYKQDAIGNVVIIREASIGRENHNGVILQNHMDMVCEKNSDVNIDFDNDPIQMYFDNDGWAKAKGTTLGADCGIGMALAMAVLTDKNISTPRIEALFTVDEETGLTGAFELGTDMLNGKYMINLDSEDEGDIYIGCAGGIDTVANFTYNETEVTNNSEIITLNVSGLKGGHSGDDINKNLANSNIILCRFLDSLEDFQLLDIDGGNLRNAIPREAYATIAVKDEKEILEKFNKYQEVVKAEYHKTEPNLQLSAKKVNSDKKAIDNTVARNVIKAVIASPNAVQAMSQDIEGFVETSTNLASMKIKNNTIEIVSSQRSSLESKKIFLAKQIKTVMEAFGAEVNHSDGYPGWTPVPESNLLETFKDKYKEIFKKEILVKVIHAGLECGLILKKYPNLEMVSIGPTLRGVHSPDEKLEIKTVDMVWKLLVKVIEKIN